MRDGSLMEWRNKGWNLKEQEEFLLRIGDLYVNGYALLEAIELMCIHYEGDKKADLKLAINELKNGYGIHKVLEMLQFHQDVLSLLFFSQRHGNLGEAFRSAGQMLKRKRYYKQKLHTLIRYPIFLMVMVMLMLFFVQTVLLPQFTLLFQQMNISINKSIQLFFTITSKLPLLLLFLGFLAAVLLILIKTYANSVHPIKKISWIMKIPILRTFLTLHYSHYFSQQLSSLLASGMTINDAIGVFEQQTYNLYFKYRATEYRERLLEGEKLEKVAGTEMVFDKGLAPTILHGQKNGRLPRELEDFSGLLLDKLQRKMESALGKIQPCLFLAIGLFVLVLYLCIFIPMFQLLGGL
ncbi:competence protein ComGB [Bacillus tianshenii]|uniref:Competence protein ComGB n=2 Tax=Sutcliffiella tianshenii TaxID=1463404 RepID=A0ABS2NZS7_9BACI|nr:competence protein ComGB [Bacillus tianshenii]